MRQNPHVRICGGPGSATTLVYPTPNISDGVYSGLRATFGQVLLFQVRLTLVSHSTGGATDPGRELRAPQSGEVAQPLPQ